MDSGRNHERWIPGDCLVMLSQDPDTAPQPFAENSVTFIS
jgi:hypothetical protein